MSFQQDNLMEELANRDFIFTEEAGTVVVYEKDTREGSETVTLFDKEHYALYQQWNQNGILVANSRYDTNHSAEITKLLSACH